MTERITALITESSKYYYNINVCFVLLSGVVTEGIPLESHKFPILDSLFILPGKIAAHSDIYIVFSLIKQSTFRLY